MNQYRWALKDGSKAKISFSTNLDNLINKYRNNVVVESVFLMDCGIVYAMPYIMRYCFEEKVNLRKRAFLRDLPSHGPCEINKLYLRDDFQRPLRSDAGIVSSFNGDLIIYSTPKKFFKSKISFNPKDVPELVEGILRVLDYEGVRLAQIICTQTVQYYYKCLDSRLIR